MKLLHIVTDTPRMLKNHLSWNDTDKVTNYFVMSKKYHKYLYKKRNNPFYHHFLDNFLDKNIITHIDNNYLQIIQDIQPDFIIISEDGPSYYDYGKVPMIYIHHGLTSKLFEHRKIVNQWNNKCMLYIGIGSDFKTLAKRTKISKNKVILLPGLPQIDYFLSVTKQSSIDLIRNYTKKQKTILFIFGSTVIDTFLQKDFKKMIRKGFGKYLDDHDLHLFIKSKKDYNSTDYNAFYRTFQKELSTNLTIIPYDVPVYDYFYCDLVMVQEGGSCYMESLYVNPNTLLLQIDDNLKNDYVNSEKYDLYKVTHRSDLIDVVDKFLYHPEEILTDNYLKRVKEYLDEMLEGKLEHVCPQIYQIFGRYTKKFFSVPPN